MASEWKRARLQSSSFAQVGISALLRVSGILPLCITLAVAGCISHKPRPEPPQKPDVSPTTAPLAADALKLDASQVKPMFTELMAIDLKAVVSTAVMDNLGIQLAKEAVVVSQGRYESAVGALYPAIVPTAIFEHVSGTVRATEGDLVGVGFNTFQPSIALQWVLNPGQVLHNIVAARKRLYAAGHEEEAVILETLRQAVVQYYDLVLAQASVSAADQGVQEAKELLRINRLHIQAGTGVVADELRAVARLALRRQDLILAMKKIYDASVALAVTLHLDASVTLVPNIEELPPIHLVRGDIPIDELLGIAVGFRPDLKQVRLLVEAVTSDRGATWWSGFGPQFAAGYQYGGITGHANNVTNPSGIPGTLILNPASASGAFSPNPFANGVVREAISKGSLRLGRRKDKTFGLSRQIRATASASWRLSVSAFGDLKAAKAMENQAHIDALIKLDMVKADVVSAAQTSRATGQLIELAHQQVVAADEALRLTEANLEAGTMTTLDVLQSQDAATQARLRHAEAIITYNQSQVNLLASLGLLDEASLVPPGSPEPTPTP